LYLRAVKDVLALHKIGQAGEMCIKPHREFIGCLFIKNT
jgi:hypothetical protein